MLEKGWFYIQSLVSFVDGESSWPGLIALSGADSPLEETSASGEEGAGDSVAGAFEAS
jgi:hypothetical protein